MRELNLSKVTALLLVNGWTEIEPGSLNLDGIHIDLAPVRCALYRDLDGVERIVPTHGLFGYVPGGELETYVNPHAVQHAYTGVDFTEGSPSPRYAPSNVQR